MSAPRKQPGISGSREKSLDGTFAVTRRLAAIVVATTALCVAGCSGLDFGRMQANMDKMTYYMGIMSSQMPMMVYTTKRMADSADQMQGRADRLIKELQQKGKSGERTIYDMYQTFHGNDRDMIDNLKGIRKELGDIKHSLGAREGTDAARCEG